MRKHKRPDWRKLPPKKMIKGAHWLRLVTKRWASGNCGVDVSRLERDVARFILIGCMDGINHEVVAYGDVYEHTYTLTSMEEPFQVTVVNESVPEERRYKAMFPPRHELELEMKVSDVDVSFALYNQLIVREPESYIDVGTLA